MNPVKILTLAVLGLLLPSFIYAAPIKIKWTTSENIDSPESIYYDFESKRIFVSNISGEGTVKDGKGWISTISFDRQGRPTVKKLVEGLNAPKGLRAKGGILYVADIDEVVKIDSRRWTVLEKISVPGAKFLNDVAIDSEGKIYISDTIGSKIYQIEEGKVSVFVEGDDLESPNGLLVKDGKLYVASWGLITDPATFGAKIPGRLFSLDIKTKQKVFITKEPFGNLDGLEIAKNGDFIVSDWVAGKVFRITSGGKSKVLIDGFKHAADIGLKLNLLLVPDMGQSTVSAIEL